MSARLVREIAIHPDAAGPSAETSEQAYARLREEFPGVHVEITQVEYWGGGEWRAYGHTPDASAYVSIRRWERVTVDTLLDLLEPVTDLHLADGSCCDPA